MEDFCFSNVVQKCLKTKHFTCEGKAEAEAPSGHPFVLQCLSSSPRAGHPAMYTACWNPLFSQVGDPGMVLQLHPQEPSCIVMVPRGVLCNNRKIWPCLCKIHLPLLQTVAHSPWRNGPLSCQGSPGPGTQGPPTLIFTCSHKLCTSPVYGQADSA